MRYILTTLLFLIFSLGITAQDVKIQGPKRQKTTMSKTKQNNSDRKANFHSNDKTQTTEKNYQEPANYEEAMVGPDSNKWLEAMKSEIGSMYENEVWTLTDLPVERRAIENKWIFKRKTDADGNVTIYKARLVAKGYRQVQGVDYDETFSPVAKLKSVRIMLAIAAYYDYEI